MLQPKLDPAITINMEIMQEKDKPDLKGNGLIVADPFESLGFVRPLIGAASMAKVALVAALVILANMSSLALAMRANVSSCFIVN